MKIIKNLIFLSFPIIINASCTDRKTQNGFHKVIDVYNTSLPSYRNYNENNTYSLSNYFLISTNPISNLNTVFQNSVPIFSKQNGVSYNLEITQRKAENISGSFYNWLTNQKSINIFNDTTNLKLSYLGHLEQKETYKSFILSANYTPYDTTLCRLESLFLINYIKKNITSIIKIGGIVTDCLSLVTDWTIRNDDNTFTYRRFLDDLDIDNSIIEPRDTFIQEVYYYKFSINNKGHVEICN